MQVLRSCCYAEQVRLPGWDVAQVYLLCLCCYAEQVRLFGWDVAPVVQEFRARCYAWPVRSLFHRLIAFEQASLSRRYWCAERAWQE